MSKGNAARVLREDLLDFADELSSGTMSYADLKEAGHPYGLKRRNWLGMFEGGRGKPFNGGLRYINEHTGNFRRSWVVAEIADNETGITTGFELVNTASYANKLFDGIPGLTVARPVLTSYKSRVKIAQIQNRYEKRLVKEIAETIVDGFKGI